MSRLRGLHTGTPFWSSLSSPPLPRATQRLREVYDVIVLGAGISGSLVAESLTEDGHSVLVLDRRRPARGSTTASTALLQHELDQPLVRLSKKVGELEAITAYRRSKLALHALHERATRLDIRAELAVRDALYLAGDVLDEDGLERERALRSRAGFEVTTIDRKTLRATYGLRGAAALRSFGDLVANPVALSRGFLRAAVARGAHVAWPVTVIERAERRDHVALLLEDGRRLHARHVVLATGYELAEGVPTRGHHILSTFAIATHVQRRVPWATECLVWEASDPYLYLRTTPDGRVLCGGGDEEIATEEARDALLADKTRWLESRLATLAPGLDARAAFAWCGFFGASDDGLPSLGLLPGHRRTHGLLGYGGNGITFSMLAAQLIRTTIAGGEDPDAALFGFGRRALRRSPRR